MQLYSHMSAVTDTGTCMRRSDKNGFSLIPGIYVTRFKTFNIFIEDVLSVLAVVNSVDQTYILILESIAIIVLIIHSTSVFH